jgi:hypothetical protein
MLLGEVPLLIVADGRIFTCSPTAAVTCLARFPMVT